MDSKFEIVFTMRGQATYNRCLSYLALNLENWQAASNLYLDIVKTLDKLRNGAAAYSLIDLENLKRSDFRKVHLKKHKYKVIYHIEDNVAYIDAILHDKQDIEKALG